MIEQTALLIYFFKRIRSQLYIIKKKQFTRIGPIFFKKSLLHNQVYSVGEKGKYKNNNALVEQIYNSLWINKSKPNAIKINRKEIKTSKSK